MASIALIRVDSRLIHGQVASGWMSRGNVKRVIIFDNDLKEKPYLQDIFRMVIPSTIEFEVFSVQEAGDMWKANEFGSVGPILVLFKSVQSAFEAYEGGFSYKKLQIGGTGAAPGKKTIDGPIALNMEEATKLESLAQRGVNVYCQQTISSRERPWASVKSKFKL